MCVEQRTEVLRVEPVRPKGSRGIPEATADHFNVHVKTADGAQEAASPEQETAGAQKTLMLRARFVVWAAGEFQYPRESSCKIVGTELCLHNSRVVRHRRPKGSVARLSPSHRSLTPLTRGSDGPAFARAWSSARGPICLETTSC